jgi:hypothetical protein
MHAGISAGGGFCPPEPEKAGYLEDRERRQI